MHYYSHQQLYCSTPIKSLSIYICLEHEILLLFSLELLYCSIFNDRPVITIVSRMETAGSLRGRNSTIVVSFSSSIYIILATTSLLIVKTK